MKKSIIIISLTVILIGINSCKKETTTVETENFKGVIVVNEGQFQKSNGSIGLFKPGNGNYFDAFQQANGRPLGDVVQSINLIDGKFYIIVNNSNKIEVVNQSDFKSVGTISVNSPRQIIKMANNKACVTQLFTNNVSIVDLSNNTVEKIININSWSENLVLIGKKIYIGTNSNYIKIIHTDSMKLTDSIMVGSGINKFVKLTETTGAVFSTGATDWNTGNVTEKGRFSWFSNDSNKLSKSIELATGSYGGSMTFNSTNDEFYFTFGSGLIYTVKENGTGLAEYLNLPSGISAYGLNFDNVNQELYILDAGDFNTSGKCYVFDNNIEKRSFSTGLVPNSVFFNF